MIVERGRGRQIILRTRDENNIRVEQRIKDSYPYCFVENKNSKHIFGAISKTKGYTGLYGEELTKVVFRDPSDIHAFKKTQPEIKTWEANIPFANRVLADMPEIPKNYKHRVWFLDFEWMIDSGQITVMGVQDSYTGNMYLMFTHPDIPAGKYDRMPCVNHPEGLKEIKFDLPAIAFDDEKSMLLAFAKHLRKQDPDIITGWNVVKADCQQLIKRMKECGLDPRMLSPMSRIRYDFGDWAQPIAGINVIDLMVAFTRLWTIKNGQLSRYALDSVANECLGERKVELPDGHDTYFSDIGTYLDYAMQDVKLLPKLNSLNNAIEHYTSIQHIVGCDIRTTPFVTKLFTILALRDKHFKERIPTKPQFKKVNYEGADIQQPIAGLYNHIGILDIRAMYHSNIDLHNICWTTLDKNGKDCGNGVKFEQGGAGLLGRQMTLMTTLRDEYKAKLRAATTDEERSRYDSLQYATKSLVASMYGVAGDAKCAFYHPDIASSITHTSRETLRQLRKLCESLGNKVIYGHTDSVFVEIANPKEGEALCLIVNLEMAPIQVEFEKWCDSLLIKAKNRYAGIVSWSDGDYHDAKLYYKGIELKQSRLPEAMKTTMQRMIQHLLTGVEEQKVTSWLRELVTDIVSGKISVEKLCIKGKLEKDLSSYVVLGEARAGAAWANDKLGKGYRKGSRFLVTIDTDGNYIAFDEPKEIEGFASVGYRHLAQRFIVEKIRPYYEIMCWDFQPVLNALHGKSLMKWI